MMRDQADQERLEEANVRLGGAVDDLMVARAILADSDQTAIRRAWAQGRVSAFSEILERVAGVRV